MRIVIGSDIDSFGVFIRSRVCGVSSVSLPSVDLRQYPSYSSLLFVSSSFALLSISFSYFVVSFPHYCNFAVFVSSSQCLSVNRDSLHAATQAEKNESGEKTIEHFQF